jgi:hypothetical protein
MSLLLLAAIFATLATLMAVTLASRSQDVSPVIISQENKGDIGFTGGAGILLLALGIGALVGYLVLH